MQYGYHHENPLPNSGDFDEDSQEDYYDEEDPNEDVSLLRIYDPFCDQNLSY